MLRVALVLFIGMLLTFVILKITNNRSEQEVPTFLKEDLIGKNHTTKIEIKVKSQIKPDSVQIEKLKKDYADIWAHLNHVYATNDIVTSKSFFTEALFAQLSHHYKGVQKPVMNRQDTCHLFIIENWASDGLVCTGIDSNVIFKYTLPNNEVHYTQNHLACVLLFQGDNWRIDGLKVLSETESKYQ